MIKFVILTPYVEDEFPPLRRTRGAVTSWKKGISFY